MIANVWYLSSMECVSIQSSVGPGGANGASHGWSDSGEAASRNPWSPVISEPAPKGRTSRTTAQCRSRCDFRLPLPGQDALVRLDHGLRSRGFAAACSTRG